MANPVVGGAQLLQVVPDGALASDPQESVSVDNPAVLSFDVSPDGNLLNRRANYIGAGTAVITATAVALNGNTVQGSVSVTVDPASATLLNLSLVDLP